MAAADVSDDETLTEHLIQVLQDIITEEDVRDVDRVFRLNITRNDGADMETFFVNMKPGGDRVYRGVWPGPEDEVACRITMSAENALRVLTEGQNAAMDLRNRRLIDLQLDQFAEALRVAQFLIGLQPRFTAALRRLKGKVEPAGD